MSTLLHVIGAVTMVWALLGVSFIFIIVFLVAAWYLPNFRQFFLGCAVAAALFTIGMGIGVKKESDVMAARDARAEELRQERDKLQARLADMEAAKDSKRLKALNAKELKKESANEKRWQSEKNPCRLDAGDLR